MIDENKKNWRDISREANYWHSEGDKVQCDLCPRHCTLRNEQKGFCLVRGKVGQELHTFNYGVSVPATIENIETEAVNHFRPGAKILSMGNIGCMMACNYCQNWQTSQVKFLNDKNVQYYTPEEVVQIALENEIEIISWTYNDPVVWQEFVVDTSRLARNAGIKTLYKSALYIEEAPLAELIEVIDIFSISLKGMDPEMYRKYTKGKLGPVLERIKQIAKSDRHLEISQLIVTDLNDNEKDARETADWIIENVGAEIPLHLVAYHPAFRYTKERTQTATLLNLRDIVLERGIKYCYLGNVYADNVSNTMCSTCNAPLVKRFGLTVDVVGLDANSNCTNCGEKSPIKEALKGRAEKIEIDDFDSKCQHDFEWDRGVNSVHIELGDDHHNAMMKIIRNPSNETEYLKITEHLERLIVSKKDSKEKSIEVHLDIKTNVVLLPVLDRAHFPVKEPSSASDKYLN